jgi:hypothetical protein
MLDRGWKFHAGDEAHWSDPSFNDSAWKQVSLNDFHSYLPAFQRFNIGWFRCKVFIDSPGAAAPAIIAISQLGASEVYLNGSIFLHLGIIANGQMLVSDNPHYKPFLIRTNSIDTLNIAIRFAARPLQRGWLLAESKSLPLSVSVSDWTSCLNRYESRLTSQRIPLGLSFLTIGVGIIFLMLYIFTGDNSSVLLFAGFCFLLGLMAGLQFQLSEGNLDMTGQTGAYYLKELTDRICCIIFIAILTSLVFGRTSLYQLSLFVYFAGICSLLIYFVPPGRISGFLILLGRVWVVAELGRISFYAFARRRYILGTLAVASAVLHFSFVLHYFSKTDYTLSYYQFNQMLCFGVLSIYLICMIGSDRRNLTSGRNRT